MASRALTGSLFIDALPGRARESLMARSREVYVGRGDEIFGPEAAASEVLFPIGCVLSLLNRLQSGASVEMATVGRNGTTGITVLLGPAPLSNAFCVSVLGGKAVAVDRREFLVLIRAHQSLAELCSAYLGALVTRIGQSVACSQAHTAIQRSARWLLTAQDQTGADVLPLTHELLGTTLGTRRETVSQALGGLERTGLVRSRHGEIELLDRPGLEEAACECYQVMREASVLVPDQRSRRSLAAPAPVAGPPVARPGAETPEGRGSPRVQNTVGERPEAAPTRFGHRHGHHLGGISLTGDGSAGFVAECVCGWATPARANTRLAESIIDAHVTRERARAMWAAAGLMRLQTINQRDRARAARERLVVVAEAIRVRARASLMGPAVEINGAVAAVVHVDDNPELREQMAAALGRIRRFDLLGQGETGVDAVALATVERPRILVLDDQMPVMTGMEAIPLIRQLAPEVRICLHAEQAPAVGSADLVVLKQDSLRDLIERLVLLAA